MIKNANPISTNAFCFHDSFSYRDSSIKELNTTIQNLPRLCYIGQLHEITEVCIAFEFIFLDYVSLLFSLVFILTSIYIFGYLMTAAFYFFRIL